MPTIDEIRQWTPEQRGAYYITEVCQALGITTYEVKIQYEEVHGYTVYLDFEDETYYGKYEPLNNGGVFEVWDEDGSYVDGAEAMRKIQMAIKHMRDARNARRVAELEAKIKWLEANTAKILPQPIGEAVLDAWH